MGSMAIFGSFGIPQFERLPNSPRPRAASTGFRPGLLPGSYRSQNLHPFPGTLPTMPTYTAAWPGYPRSVGPQPAPRYQAPVVATGPTAPSAGRPMGAANMMRGQRVLNPTQTMRMGTFPRVAGNAVGVRAGVHNAGPMIARLTPNGRY